MPADIRPGVSPLGIGVLVALSVSACSAPGSDTPASGPDASPPNMIVVLVDDLRWDELGAAGHPFIQTPNIDRIAAEGAFFLNSFTTTPLCSPSRASFLTGLYAHGHGIIDNTGRSEQSHRLETFPRRLQEVGYETAFVGKWHMGNDDTPRPGFDRWAAMRGQGEAVDPTLNIDGERITFEGYSTDILTELALEFVERPRRDPFLLYLSHKALHPNLLQRDDGSTASIDGGGFIPAPRHEGMYAEVAIPRRPNAFVAPADKPALARPIADLPPLGHETATPERTIRERSEMLMAVDDGLGRLLGALERSGALDDTVIVFTSDHGYWYGEHGLSIERRLAYEEALRIPLLIRYPRLVAAGARPTQIALSIDLAPTLLELAGAPGGESLHGRSLVPILGGETPNWRRSFLVEYYSDTVFPRVLNMGYRAIRTERFKYIQYQDLEDMDELYDLVEDPYELDNRIGDPDAEQTLGQMQAELEALLENTGGY